LLFTGYNESARRKYSISVVEVGRLGWETAIQIFNIREKGIATRVGVTNFTSDIGRAFDKEPKDMGVCGPDDIVVRQTRIRVLRVRYVVDLMY